MKKIKFVNDCGNVLFETDIKKKTVIPRVNDEINLPDSFSQQKANRVIFDYRKRTVIVIIGLMIV